MQLAVDPRCALCLVAKAYAHGPFLNKPLMTAEEAATAAAAAAAAVELVEADPSGVGGSHEATSASPCSTGGPGQRARLPSCRPLGRPAAALSSRNAVVFASPAGQYSAKERGIVRAFALRHPPPGAAAQQASPAGQEAAGTAWFESMCGTWPEVAGAGHRLLYQRSDCCPPSAGVDHAGLAARLQSDADTWAWCGEGLMNVQRCGGGGGSGGSGGDGGSSPRPRLWGPSLAALVLRE